MRELPSGTVTFLFTDVEGSTRLLHELGSERYAQALAEHRRVIREACAVHGGVEVDTQGDAFFFAFPAAVAGVSAAAEMTEGLAEGPIQVRIGVHTGMPLLTEEGYVGDDVHFAARVAASSHGGQVVLSQATRELVDEGFGLVDLGEHRLKDIAQPVAIFQLGDGAFPPLKTISSTNLPRPASSFVGRDRELAEVLGRIERGARLVTLTGPGGSGKTRLAIEAAATLVPEYKAGVFWVGLAALRDPALVTETISQTLGAKDGLAEHVGERELLLLLDNLEQVIEAAPEFSALLSECPNLTLLVTSRELLRVQGEVEYAVPPLAEPEAVTLFCERAQLEPSEEIAELCARLDSLPLAVELAAARTKALAPAQILDRLSQRLDLLKGGRDADPRQQTLRATIEWSYDLLTGDEQQLFVRLSVFAGGCTIEAAEEVAGADLDTLQSLVEKSLLRFTNERYWMLETIREYATDHMDSSAASRELGRRHASYYSQLAVGLQRPLREYSSDAFDTATEELGNVRNALDFGLRDDDVELAGDLLFGMFIYWLWTGKGAEAKEWARRYLASGRQQLDGLRRYAGDVAVSEILRFVGDAEEATRLKRELVATGRSHPHESVNGWPLARSTAAILSDLAYIELDAGRTDQARVFADDALEVRREIGAPHGIAHALCAIAAIAYGERDYQRARDVYAEAMDRYAAGESWGEVNDLRLEVAECDCLLGRFEEARAQLRGLIPILLESPDQLGLVHALRLAGMLACARGDSETCAALFGAADRKQQEGGIEVFSRAEDAAQLAYLERAQDELGEDAFAIAYERGASDPDSMMLGLEQSLD